MERELEIAYTLLPPPLSAIPAKYHAPISLGLHSLSAGFIASYIAQLADFHDYRDLVFLLGVSHDIHQKLVDMGLATLRDAKAYLREKLDELGYTEFLRYVDDALEQDMCGKENPVRGLPREIATICHIGDMAQGRLEGYTLLYWLRNKVKTVSQDLTVRFYSVMIPQPFARAYAMLRIYEKHIAGRDHLALASPWGLYVVAYEDELPEVLEVSWDDLRIDTIIDYSEIKRIEESRKQANIAGIKISGDEAKSRLWSRFARMFYKSGALKGDKPLYPKLLSEVSGLFVNIVFTDVEFVELKPEETFTCGLCGIPHHKDYSLPISMYGTKQGIKIAGVRVATEKWNRFMPAQLKVKTWDSKGTWRHGIGTCPLCTLDAVAVRELGFSKTMNGFITVSVSKPIPVELLKIIGQTLRDRKSITDTPPHVGPLDGIVLDYSTATIATSINVPEPKTENMFDNGELVNIGKLLSLGFYPLKFLPGLDTSLPDRLLTTTIAFQALDFPVTSEEYSTLVPWTVKLVEVAGWLDRSTGIGALMDKPAHAPLHLLTLHKFTYDHVSTLLRVIGVRA